MFNKVTSRYYSHFLKFSYFFWQKNGFLQVGQKLQKLVKKTEGILGVKELASIQSYENIINIFDKLSIQLSSFDQCWTLAHSG
jgi:hypothetical protein